MNTLNEQELSWAAGFLDGEGYFAVKHSRRKNKNGTPYEYVYLQIAAAQCRREPLDRLRSALGGNVHGPYRQTRAKPNWSEYYMWTAGGKQVLGLIERLWPLLSTPKREQIRDAMNRWYASRKVA